MGRFENKVVIVTGASSGIGEVTAIDFAKEGAKVVITGRNEERLGATAKQCKDAGAEVHEFVGNLAEFINLEVLVNETVKKFGRIDILVNNAGFGDVKPIEQIDVEVYDRMFDVNVRAPVFLCKYALPYLKKSKGCVVNVSSVAGLTSNPGSVPYSMTKAALDHFARGFSAGEKWILYARSLNDFSYEALDDEVGDLASGSCFSLVLGLQYRDCECAPFGVRVNNINPALVVTPFVKNLGVPKEQVQGLLEMFKNMQPFGLIDPQQISKAILFLCTSEMITGVTLPVDAGGLHSSKMQ